MATRQLSLLSALPEPTTAAARDAATGLPITTELPLSAQLRRSTRAIHAHTEAAFELDRWLADRESYAALLTLLWGFHTATETALVRVDGWDLLTPRVDLAGRRRAFRIEQDLAELGAPGPAVRPIDANVDATRSTDIAEGLGCLYVLEGSGLGGRVIAARGRAVLGPRLPTAFFADPDRNLGQEWNALRASLDAFGTGADGTVRQSVIDAAHRTFARFAAILVRGRSHR